MKTKQTKIDRSGAKLLPGAMALAAITSASQAATVQITLTGNKISNTGGNLLFADLTGDGSNDINILYPDVYFGTYAGWANVFLQSRGNTLVGGTVYGQCEFTTYSGHKSLRADAAFVPGGVSSEGVGGDGRYSHTCLNSITFADGRVNGGVATGAWLEVHAFTGNTNNNFVQLTRLIFDDASTTRPTFSAIPGTLTEWSAVPEPGSLALLALGAGGLTMRRSRKAQAA